MLLPTLHESSSPSDVREVEMKGQNHVAATSIPRA